MSCPEGQYFCNDRQKCMPIPRGYHLGYRGWLEKDDDNNGKKNGKQINWYDNGQKEVEGNYGNDEPVKTWLWWYIDGAPMQEGGYNGQGNFEGLYFINPPVPDVFSP